MDNINLINEARQRYLSAFGPGQFSWFRFADWLIDNEPELARTILIEGLRLYKTLQSKGYNKAK